MDEQEKTNSLSRTAKRGRFMQDLGIYAIGNIGSKLITFLLVPYYTFYITDPAAMGYYDLCLTAVFCLGPLISFEMTDTTFRFLVDEHNESVKRSVISYAGVMLLRNSVILIVIGLIFNIFKTIEYFAYVIVFAIMQATYDVIAQIARGFSRKKLFVSANIFSSTFLMVMSILFVGVLQLGLSGIFIAQISSRVAGILLVNSRLHLINRYISRRYLNSEVCKQMFRYACPLLPAVIVWWVLNSNNLLFIRHYLGLYENGIYAILAKFSNILYVLTTIFYQTWQQHAVEQYTTPDRNVFFSKVFNNYFYLISGLVLFLPFVLRMNFGWLVSEDYQESAIYLYANSIYVMMFALSSFFELGYQCSKQTFRILPTTVVAATLNVLGNYLFIPKFGIYGVVISSVLAYVVLAIYRYFDTRKYMRITLDWRCALCVLMLGVGLYVYMNFHGLKFDISYLFVAGGLYVFMMPKDWKNAIRKFAKTV